MTYDWTAALVFVLVLVALSTAGRFLVFKVPAFARMRDLNRHADQRKLSSKRFRRAVKINNTAGLWTNVVFIAAILPFCISLEARPLWRHGMEIVAVLLVFDFFYYLTHRFLFHGKALRRVHALHHQARTPTYIDALYVHPVETIIGLTLFFGSIPLVAGIAGAPLSALSMAIATLMFTHLNQLNHTWVSLPYFPFKTVDFITSIHAAHHVDMNRGNYATLTTLYDWLFGTLEKPESRPSP
jgi:sterol desaturase/sphingolipid hydroxylase (fatty acid hydroxylase superfamily)